VFVVHHPAVDLRRGRGRVGQSEACYARVTSGLRSLPRGDKADRYVPAIDGSLVRPIASYIRISTSRNCFHCLSAQVWMVSVTNAERCLYLPKSFVKALSCSSSSMQFA
jgi:hypothetical protein